MRRSVGLRRKIRGALAYPSFLLLASLGMVIFLTVYVVPRMSELFAGFGGNLPTVTTIVLGISGWITGNAFWFAPLVIASSIAISAWSRTPPGRLTVNRFILKIPLGGKLVVQLAVSQCARSLATLLAGGITLVESWEISAESLNNLDLRQRSIAILPLIREGQAFTESLETAEWVPDLAIHIVGIGQRSGS